MTHFLRFFLAILIICGGHLRSLSQCQTNSQINFLDRTTFVEFCNEDVDKCIAAQPNSPPGTSYGYVLTNRDGIILAAHYANTFCLEVYGPGIFRLYGVSIQGLLRPSLGQPIETAKLGSFCHMLSDNFLTAKVVQLDVGELALSPSGQRSFCNVNGEGQIISIETSNDGTNNESYNIFITDAQGVIINILDLGQNFNTISLPQASYQIFGLAYSGRLTLAIGDLITSSPPASGCFQLSVDPISIEVTTVDGGQVSNGDQGDEVFVCPMNGTDDIVSFNTNSTSDNLYRYLITNDTGVIIGLPIVTSFNFDIADPGICLVYGVSFSGNFLAETGDQIEGLNLSDGCFDLSENKITVYRFDPEAGNIFSDNEQEVIYTCPNDDMLDIIHFNLAGNTHSKTAYAVTDDQNIVLAITSNSLFDFTLADEGICRIYGIAFTGSLLLMEGDTLSNQDLSDDCFDLSDNYLEVVRAEPKMHDVFLEGGDTAVELCVGDGADDILTLNTDISSLAQFVYMFTNDKNELLSITSNTAFNFEGAGDGICRIWGLSFTGILIAEVGDTITNLPLADNCFELSNNFIEVTRRLIDAGTVLSLANESQVFTCPGDGQADIVSYSNSISTSAHVMYVITTVKDTILAFTSEQEFDFEGAGAGTCRIWSIVYIGDLLLSEGDVITEGNISSECADLSDGFLTVDRFIPSVGSIVSSGGFSSVQLCLSDGEDHVVNYMSLEQSNADFIYIITNDQDTILELTTVDSIDFDSVPLGICRIYGLSYVGDLILEVGGAVGDVATDLCFAYSTNYLEIIRELVVESTVSSMGTRQSVINLCPGDGLDDTVVFANSSDNDDNYRYIIADEDDRVLFLPSGNSVNFENVREGVCRVYGASFTGNFILRGTDALEFFPISDACYQLSSNFLELRKFPPIWEVFSTTSNETAVEVIVGDGLADIVEFSSDGLFAGNSVILITDDAGIVIGITAGRSVDFEGTGEGICVAWGLAYTGELIIEEGDNINDGEFSSDCFDLSDNVVTVTRTAATPGLNKLPTKFTYSHESGYLHLDNLTNSNYELHVYDIQGQIAFDKHLSDIYRQEIVDLNSLKEGIYIIYLMGDSRNSLETYKIAVSK